MSVLDEQGRFVRRSVGFKGGFVVDESDKDVSGGHGIVGSYRTEWRERRDGKDGDADRPPYAKERK